MNTKIRLTALLLCLMANQALRLLLDLLAADGSQWQMHDVGMHATSFLFASLVFWLVPAHEALSKCLSCALAAFEVVPLIGSVVRLFDIRLPDQLLAIQCAAAISIGTWLFCTHLDTHNKKGDDDVAKG